MTLTDRKLKAEAIYLAAEAVENGVDPLEALSDAAETTGTSYQALLRHVTRTIRRDPLIYRAFRSFSARQYLAIDAVNASVAGVRLLRRAGWWLATGHAPDEDRVWQS